MINRNIRERNDHENLPQHQQDKVNYFICW